MFKVSEASELENLKNMRVVMSGMDNIMAGVRKA